MMLKVCLVIVLCIAAGSSLCSEEVKERTNAEWVFYELHKSSLHKSSNGNFVDTKLPDKELTLLSIAPIIENVMREEKQKVVALLGEEKARQYMEAFLRGFQSDSFFVLNECNPTVWYNAAINHGAQLRINLAELLRVGALGYPKEDQTK